MLHPPGRFNAFGTFATVYFLVAGVVVRQMPSVASFVQQLLYGGALVIAVALPVRCVVERPHAQHADRRCTRRKSLVAGYRR